MNMKLQIKIDNWAVTVILEEKKVEVLKERYPNVTPICVKVTPEWI